MTKPTVYVETSVVSYPTALGSRDLVLAAHQELTRAWWESRNDFGLYASQIVIEEASAGDAGAASRRLEASRGIPLLNVTDDASLLATSLVRDVCLIRRVSTRSKSPSRLFTVSTTC